VEIEQTRALTPAGWRGSRPVGVSFCVNPGSGCSGGLCR
jgi:hypothetical protein